MFSTLGAPEILLILLVVLIVFGPGKLPSIGSALGKGVREFRHAVNSESEPAEPTAKTVPPPSEPAR